MKYGNKKTEYNHIIYDSKKEAKRAFELDMLERAGEISGVQRQVTYKLEVNGILVCKYKADFTYCQNGKLIVEDVKGFKTATYRLKKKLLLAVHGIVILET